VVQVRGCSVEGHGNVISAHVKVLVVKGLMDVAHKLEWIDKLLGNEFEFLRPRGEENVHEDLLERRRPRAGAAAGKCGKAGRRRLREEVVRNVTTYVDNHLLCLVTVVQG
jgi:hypothetical protein